ncbi:MAG: formylglycine-generating enzyme family protein [endosymbiont of Escarpia spicata]|uniref:Formylglycine-generating enzyme family protein n=1 Tax=endosymbiont of Escarpia spicata TaxID=2200908 RepID=A0A370DS13_9GAMM|nr:MAG: formylglycine-generating enzyme family protein [endosymbiont of Escarpia spicata]
MSQFPQPFPPAWASGWGEDDYGHYAEFEISGVTQRLRWVYPGTFLMGSPETEAERSDDETQHQVTITQGYWLADTACTQRLWEAVMGGNPSHFKGEDRPVERVSWQDVAGFLDRLSQQQPDPNLRLPTESEWEYACRAGTETPFAAGEQIPTDQANYNGRYPYGDGPKGQYREETIEVKALAEGVNTWGLHQMHGNVWEWCADWYGDYPEGEVVDPVGPPGGESRVLRGGSWINGGRSLRSAYRDFLVPGSRYHFIGLRLARGQKSG